MKEQGVREASSAPPAPGWMLLKMVRLLEQQAQHLIAVWRHLVLLHRSGRAEGSTLTCSASSRVPHPQSKGYREQQAGTVGCRRSPTTAQHIRRLHTETSEDTKSRVPPALSIIGMNVPLGARKRD